MPNWLTDYVQYTSSTEPPERFHYWTAVTIIGTVLGRRRWLATWSGHEPDAYRISPNFYVVLVGEAAVRKSTALGYGRTILHDYNEHPKVADTPNVIHFSADVQSRHAFNDQMEAAGGHLLVCTGEFAEFMFGTSVGRAHPDADFVQMLQKMYDLEEKQTYKIRNLTMTIQEPFLNIIGGITPKTLPSVLPSEAVWAGLASRMIFVIEPSMRQRNERVTLDKDMRSSLVQRLVAMHDLPERFDMTPEAEQAYSTWYRAQPTSNFGTEFEGRLAGHIGRLALVMAAAELSPVVTLGHFEGAKNHIFGMGSDVRQLLALTGNNPFAKVKIGIQQAIVFAGGVISEPALYDRLWFQYEPRVIEEGLNWLWKMGHVKKGINSKRQRTYRLIENGEV